MRFATLQDLILRSPLVQMGNLIPGGRNVNVWDFLRSDGLPDVTRVKAYYNGDVVQQVRIAGPNSLTLTLEVDNANIEVRGDDHRISLVGRNNTITVFGSRATLRIEGEENQLKGDGQDTALYTDHEITVEGLELALRNLLTQDGIVVDGAPQKLELWDQDMDRPTTWESPAIIRCTYAPVPRDGGGDGDHQSASTANLADSKDDPNQNDGDSAVSPSGSGDNLSGKRQNDAGGDQDHDQNDESKSKKARAD